MTDSSTENRPSLSIAICTYARGPILIATLNNLIPQAREHQAEILVVDQWFDHAPEILRQLEAWSEDGTIRWLRVDNNSLTGKRNIALREAKSDIILYVDDDVIAPDNFLAKHSEAYRDETISGLTGQVYHALNPDHPPSLEDPDANSRKHFIEERPMETRSFIGCNHSVRRAAAIRVGGFDERFIASSQCEDFDIADRLADAGFRLWYDPDTWLIHLRASSGGTRGASTSSWPEWTRTANIFLYAFRHGKTHHNRISLFIRALRTGPLRKEIVKQPLKWLPAWAACVQGAAYGWRYRKRPVSEWSA